MRPRRSRRDRSSAARHERLLRKLEKAGRRADLRSSFWREIYYVPAPRPMPVLSPASFGLAYLFVKHVVEPIVDALLSPYAEVPHALHPEAAEPIRTKVDERQEGRSEVIRAIARGHRH